MPEIAGTNVNVDFAFRGGMQIAGADDLALFDENHGVAGDFHFAEQMGIKEDGGATLALVANDVADEVAAHGVKAGSGLIEEDEFRLVDESLGEANALHHTFGKAAEATVAMWSKADEFEIGGDAVAQLGGCESTEAAMKGQEFGGGQPVVKAKIFGEEADFAAHFDVLKRAAKNLRVAAGGSDKAEKHFDGSAFAGTVGSEETEDFAATDLERKAAHGHFGAEELPQAGGFDGQVVDGRQRVLRGLRVRYGE